MPLEHYRDKSVSQSFVKEDWTKAGSRTRHEFLYEIRMIDYVKELIETFCYLIDIDLKSAGHVLKATNVSMNTLKDENLWANVVHHEN
jgi:hypothetical protein